VKYVVFKHEMMLPHLCGFEAGLNVGTHQGFRRPAFIPMSLSRFFRFLSLPGFGSRRSVDRQMGQIRTAMLSLLQVHGGHSVQRVAQRVRFAGDLEALWYLRQDVLTALSAVDGEVAARRQMTQINRLFKGGLPDTMGPRTHQRITS
jgi:hypothetical protein